MAVPKRKTSKRRKRLRRGGKGIAMPNLTLDPTTGEYHVSHHVSKDGFYNGKQVLTKEEETSEEA